MLAIQLNDARKGSVCVSFGQKNEKAAVKKKKFRQSVQYFLDHGVKFQFGNMSKNVKKTNSNVLNVAIVYMFGSLKTLGWN